MGVLWSDSRLDPLSEDAKREISSKLNTIEKSIDDADNKLTAFTTDTGHAQDFLEDVVRRCEGNGGRYTGADLALIRTYRDRITRNQSKSAMLLNQKNLKIQALESYVSVLESYEQYKEAYELNDIFKKYGLLDSDKSTTMQQQMDKLSKEVSVTVKHSEQIQRRAQKMQHSHQQRQEFLASQGMNALASTDDLLADPYVSEIRARIISRDSQVASSAAPVPTEALPNITEEEMVALQE